MRQEGQRSRNTEAFKQTWSKRAQLIKPALRIGWGYIAVPAYKGSLELNVNYKGYKGKRHQSRRLTAGLFMMAKL
eukprot:1137809-Pelagomonas_calceolata.AAC.7